jgi:hypothetical protein
VDIEVTTLNKSAEAVKTQIKEYVRAMEVNTKRLPETVWLNRPQGRTVQTALKQWADERNKGSALKAPVPDIAESSFRGIPIKVHGGLPK